MMPAFSPGALDDRAGAGEACAFCRQAAQVHARGLVAAVLGPHDGEDAELGEGWGAAKLGEDERVLLVRDAVRLEQRRGDGDGFGALAGSRAAAGADWACLALVRLSHGRGCQAWAAPGMRWSR